MNKKFCVATCGYPSIDRLVKLSGSMTEGKTTTIENDYLQPMFGGCSVNIAYTLAKLGVSTKAFFVAGNDFESSGYKAFLQEANVDISAVVCLEEYSTSSSLLIESEKGCHTTLFAQGAMNGTIKTILDEQLNGVDLALLAVGESNYNESFKAEVLKRKIPLLFSMKFDTTAFDKEQLMSNIYDSTVIFTNQSEYENLKEYLGISKQDFLRGNCKCLVVTLGNKGCKCIYQQGDCLTETYVGIAKEKKIEDSLGVGDGFVAGFIYGLSRSESYQRCCEFGSTVASFILEGKGCLNSSPDVNAIQERIKENY